MLLLLDTDDEVLIVTQNSKNANFSFLADCFKATEACPVLNPLILLQKGLYYLLCTFLTSVLQDAVKTVSSRAIFIAVLMPSGAGFILEVLHFV